jgi:flagellar basal body rod protein FlgG
MVSISSPASIALSGLVAAQFSLQASAHNIANTGTMGFRRQQISQVAEPGGDVSTTLVQSPEAGNLLETDVVGLLQAKNSILANLAAFRTSDRMTWMLFIYVS